MAHVPSLLIENGTPFRRYATIPKLITLSHVEVQIQDTLFSMVSIRNINSGAWFMHLRTTTCRISTIMWGPLGPQMGDMDSLRIEYEGGRIVRSNLDNVSIT